MWRNKYHLTKIEWYYDAGDALLTRADGGTFWSEFLTIEQFFALSKLSNWQKTFGMMHTNYLREKNGLKPFGS